MIILLGVAGSGKSVQGKLIAKTLNCEYFSTGEFLRQVTDPVIQKKMRSGILVEDGEVIRVTEAALLSNNPDAEFVLDGFLRTIPQVKWLVSSVKSGEFHITDVLNLKAKPKTIVSRLLDRQRPDDQLDIIKRRIAEHEQTIKPIIGVLEDAGIEVNNINADQPIERVHEDIMKLLGPKLNK